MSKKVTMQQIADYLGVSKFVVSKALSGKDGVSPATKERVIQAASQLGYFAQRGGAARQEKPGQLPAGGSKPSVLVLMPNIRFQTKESVYWGRILDGISIRLEERGYGMVIISEYSIDGLLHVLNPNGLLGMIGVGEISTSLLLEVHRCGLPMVLIDHEDPLIPSDTVFVNNYDCMYKLTQYLIGIGHRDLLFAGNIRFSRSFFDRWNGFRGALEKHGIPLRDDHLIGLEGISGYSGQFADWASCCRAEGKLPSAVVCANDSIAIDALQAFGEIGLSVPGDLSLCGFDDIEDAQRVRPALTTVHVPKQALGRKAVDRLLERVASPREPHEKILISGEMVYRESSRETIGRKRK
ncbi:MAG: LacI family transcriptional regulator [Thermobacillus sp.]|uniref:LacI family DNA-binding transcriptional regulator n=1 Tax=Thermobacillus sp. TaxID=2108467 RepID=UPI000E36F4F4|nr:LacI family DNA-binding transcriptional regulator [Thermobacillus sp.]REK56198.1 MAG: LacI family transcriptional regulator [Thermobacillus sp.]